MASGVGGEGVCLFVCFFPPAERLKECRGDWDRRRHTCRRVSSARRRRSCFAKPLYKMAIFLSLFFFLSRARTRTSTHLQNSLPHISKSTVKNGDLPKNSEIKHKGDLVPSAPAGEYSTFPQTREEEI